MNIHLPKRFQQKLEDAPQLELHVKQVLLSYSQLAADTLYFFPEYTDHGVVHIENVLIAADKLVPDNVFSETMSAHDICYLTLAIILHDAGMHIQIDGFNCLLEGANDHLLNDIDNRTWSQLWAEFFSEAKKFSGKQLLAIFGNENTVISQPPFSQIGEITNNDRLLIGEFLRRHHGRLAHEIALSGFPGKPQYINFCEELSGPVRDLVGLVARSHGMNLRTCLNYIETFHGKDNRKFLFNCHAVYLMVLLRIADYIQVDSTRVSETKIKVRTFSSPISRLEQNAHLAIDFVNDKFNDDPERIYVSASPKDSEMYLKLKKLMRDIQYELDVSWAVLGELYGLTPSKPEIKFRRITSNLDDSAFTQRQLYVADTFAFKANDEIVKLLIAPLYGDHPRFGIRELLQNAIDACNERSVHDHALLKNYSPKVIVKVEQVTNGYQFQIMDNGIGMDINVIKNYLLSAGASFRKSSDWQKEFLDETGNSKVRRSGRFGVGVLAAFLIGHEISVKTRKVDHLVGYSFKAGLNTPQINVLKDLSADVGTTITIEISEQMFTALKPKNRYDEEYHETQWFKWFVLQNPPIEYYYAGQQLIPYQTFNPDLTEPLPKNWHAIEFPNFNKIYWTYDNVDRKVKFSCNGIVIQHTNYRLDVFDTKLLIRAPVISIFDNNGFTPITLDRNSFSNKLPFGNSLLEDIYKDFIAHLLLNDNYPTIDDDKIVFEDNNKYHPALGNEYTRSNFSFGSETYPPNEGKIYPHRYFLGRKADYLLYSEEGYTLNYNYFLNKLGGIHAMLFQSAEEEFAVQLNMKDCFIAFTNYKIKSIPDYMAAIFPHNSSEESNSANVFMTSERYHYLFTKKVGRVPKWFEAVCKLEEEKGKWCHLTVGNMSTIRMTMDLMQKNKDLNFVREFDISCKKEGDPILDALLREYIGNNVIIPYRMSDRKKKYRKAFKELQKYMIKYL